MATIMKAIPADAGCWVEGSRGKYAVTAVIQRAVEHGMTFEADSLDAVAAYITGAEYRYVEDGLVKLDLYDEIHEIADAAESWLNEHVAPHGHTFGWQDGEFFLWPDNEWEDDGH